MALVWQTRLVRLEDITEDDYDTGMWEPFAVIWDPETEAHLVVLKTLVEQEGERSSTKPENKVVWDPDLPTEDREKERN